MHFLQLNIVSNVIMSSHIITVAYYNCVSTLIMKTIKTVQCLFPKNSLFFIVVCYNNNNI